MTDQLINTLTGAETWPGVSSSFYLFVAKLPGEAYKERGMWEAAGDTQTTTVRAVTPSVMLKSAPDRDPDKGKWFSRGYSLPEGALLKLVVHQSAAVWGERRKRVQKFLLVSQHAPLVNVGLDLAGVSGRGDRALVSRAFVYGRVRLLDLDDAITLGAFVPPRSRHMFEDANGDALDIQYLDNGSEPTPEERAATTTVADVHGTPVQITVRRKGRAVR
jgi:hypothetical protein